MIPTDPSQRIQNALTALEREERIRILWACESGSRAWGFASPDSDYDVRFLYLRHTEDYLRASKIRDVIEVPSSGDLDLSGWDLTKALGLFRKSNPPLMEWLASPVVYRRHEGFLRAITPLVPEYFSPVACLHHYLSMAERNRRSYLGQPTIRLKRYFYMLRPLLACMWIDRRASLPPMEFDRLLAETLPDGRMRTTIEELLARKKRGEDLGEAPPIPILSDFIQAWMDAYTSSPAQRVPPQPWGPLDALFRRMLVDVNGDRIETA